MSRNICELDLVGLDMEYESPYGCEVDLTNGEGQLLANMSKGRKAAIRQAARNGVIIEEAADAGFADDYYTQLRDVFAKQNLAPTYDAERVRALIKWVHPTGNLLLLRAREPNGTCIATGIFPAFNDTAHFWGGASWRRFHILRPNDLLMWHALLYWKRRGMKRFDMEGGGDYKRKYGTSEIRVPWIRIPKHRAILHLRNTARQLRDIYRRTRGLLIPSASGGKGKDV